MSEITCKDLEYVSDFLTYKSHYEVMTFKEYPEVTILKLPTVSILNQLLLTNS